MKAAIIQAIDGLNGPFWETVQRTLSVEVLEGEWYFYYVTFGPDRERPKASWCISPLKLKAHKNPGTLSGQLFLGPPFETKRWVLDTEAEIVSWELGTLILRSYRQGDREPGTSLLSKWLLPPGASDPVLVGVNTCISMTKNVVASPAILSRFELSEFEREAFLRQEAVTLLSPNLANKPRVSPTADI